MKSKLEDFVFKIIVVIFKVAGWFIDKTTKK